MVRKRSATQGTVDPRKPLETVSNRKRQQAPSANCDYLIEPPNKKQKMSYKKSKSDKKEEENDHHEESLFLSHYTFETITIKRIQFNNEQNAQHNNESTTLKFDILSNKNNDSDNWIKLSDIFSNAFKYSSPLHPTSKQIAKQFINALKLFLKRKCITYPLSIFYQKVNQKYYISEKGFCILLFFMKDFDDNNDDLQHFSMYRFYYRTQIFGRKISGFNINSRQSIDNIEQKICRKCCLEDIEQNVDSENPCDCGCVLHLNCTEINSFKIPNNESKLEKWFCPFCINSGLSFNKLVKRRNNFIDNGEFEVEKVIDYDITDDKYTVTWKNYPTESSCKTEISSSFMELINDYWKNKQIPFKAQNGINLIMKDIKYTDIDIQKQMTNLDIKMKSENDLNIVENNTFIPVKLHNIMDKKYIIRRQKYTKETYERYKLTRDKYRKRLQKEVKNETTIGMELKREMKYSKTKRLPKYHLRSINKDWDCDLPRIHDIIVNFLKRDWNKWEHNVSHKSFVIGDIIDPENPALKYGGEQGVHDFKAYGLFAIKKIIKDTLLFEYSGCVKPVGDASKHLDHLETELNQTTLFDLIGHVDQNRNKLFWGKKANDALVVDPSRWHNEGVYMNDYRDRVMDDPDDDEHHEVENNNNNNKNHNQMRKQNVKFYEVLVNNWPRVFAVAIDDIQSGQELLGDYGCDFWANFRIMMKRQRQLVQIKNNINNKWEEKYNELQIKCQQQQREIQHLKTELMASLK